MYTLLYLKQVMSKDLLYNTEKSAKYFVITYLNEKKKKNNLIKKRQILSDHFLFKTDFERNV